MPPIFNGPLGAIVAALVAALVVWRLFALLTILDRQRYWSFFKAYLICYVSLVGLYIVIDAFSNLDEFTKRTNEPVELFQIMGRYYLVHQSQFFDQLSGVIGMMAAIFTVTWMQRNNEQIAILAAGVSTNRAIFPVLVASVVVSALSVANQEVIIPHFGDELARRHDDDGRQRVTYVSSRYDSRKTMLYGRQADRASRTIISFFANIDPQVFGQIHAINSPQASYIPADHPTAPLKGGWLIRDATINPPIDVEALQENRELLIRVVDTAGFPPPLALGRRARAAAAAKGQAQGQASAQGPGPGRPKAQAKAETRARASAGASAGAGPQPATGPERADAEPETETEMEAEAEMAAAVAPHSEIAYWTVLPPLPLSLNVQAGRAHELFDQKMEFGRGTYFLRSTLTFQAMTRKATWYQFANTRDLVDSLADPSTEGSEEISVAIFVHSRILRPFLGMTLLLMSLPLVLGGLGRNMFIYLGLALGNSALFYGTLIFSQYLGSFTIIPPALTAWGPFILFGTVATLRWGRIRT